MNYRIRTVKERNGVRIKLTCCACKAVHEVFVPKSCGSVEDGKAMAMNAMDYHACPVAKE